MTENFRFTKISQLPTGVRPLRYSNEGAYRIAPSCGAPPKGVASGLTCKCFTCLKMLERANAFSDYRIK